MKNDYEVRGDVTAIFINSPKYGKFEVLISTNSLERAQEFSGSWYVNKDHKANSFYVHGNEPRINGKQKRASLHRWITNAPKGMMVDHRNHDTLNNKDENLRICTTSENTQNRKGATAANKSSGIRGVTWNKAAKKWKVQMRIKKNNIFLGVFDEKADAEQAAIEGRAKYMPFSVDVA